MKKGIVILLSAMALALAGCSSSDSTNETEAETVAETEAETAAETAGKIEAEDTGTASMYIENASGTSENGNIPVQFISGDGDYVQIGYVAENFDGSMLTYIYIDGTLSDKQQIGEMTQGSLDLQGDTLSVGTHTVQFIQYDSGEEDGNIVECHSAQYEVKEE